MDLKLKELDLSDRDRGMISEMENLTLLIGEKATRSYGWTEYLQKLSGLGVKSFTVNGKTIAYHDAVIDSSTEYKIFINVEQALENLTLSEITSAGRGNC